MEEEISDERVNELAEFLWNVLLFTDDVQRDISTALMLDEANRKLLSEQLEMTEEKMQKEMDKAAFSAIKAMPLASMNRCNMFFLIMSKHSNLTNDPLMHRVIEVINRRALEYN